MVEFKISFLVHNSKPLLIYKFCLRYVIFKKHIFIGKGLRYERSGTSEKINKTED